MTPLFSPELIRNDFPIFENNSHSKRLVYLDTANSAQKPKIMIDDVAHFTKNSYANVHRAIYQLSQKSTQAFEDARSQVATFLHADHSRNIIFTRGATESINLVASSLGRFLLQSGDVILLSEMEHHSNIVPWQLIAKQTGAQIHVIPINESSELDLYTYKHLLHKHRPKIVALTHVSNSLGTINPIAEMISIAHTYDTLVLVDGSQAAPHLSVDVKALDCDFYVFSGHKVYGPTGIGVLYGKTEWLSKMPPYHGGGDMIESVTFEESTFKDAPAKFEAGTPNILGAVGLASSIRYLQQFSIKDIALHETQLSHHTQYELSKTAGIRFLSLAKEKAGIITYVIDGIHAQDYATLLDQDNIAVRVGHHCTQPIMKKFGIDSSIRVSFGMYNTSSDTEQFLKTHQKVIQLLR